jgi:hypothetical protein
MAIERGLGALKEYLPRGYTVAFGKRYGCSRSKIYKVAHGELVDYRILKALKEEAEANLKISQQITNTNKKLKK